MYIVSIFTKIVLIFWLTHTYDYNVESSEAIPWIRRARQMRIWMGGMFPQRRLREVRSGGGKVEENTKAGVPVTMRYCP